MLEQVLLASALLFATPLSEDTTLTTPTDTEATTSEDATTTTTSEEEIITSGGGEITYEDSEEEVIETLKEWLVQFFDSNLVGFIINWAIDAGLISIIAMIYFKFRKYKAKSSQEIANEVKAQINEILGSEFQKLSAEQQKTILEKIDKFTSEIETLKKALVLAQDRTAEGKIALLNLINETTKEVEVIKTIKEVEKKVEHEVEKEHEVKDKVKNDYKPVD